MADPDFLARVQALADEDPTRYRVDGDRLLAEFCDVDIPDFPALLKVLDDRGIRIEPGENGRVRIDAPAGAMAPEIRMACRRYRDLLAWTVTARGTGHTWAPCNQCGQVVLLDPAQRLTGKHVWPRCYLTPGCTGRHTTLEEAKP